MMENIYVAEDEMWGYFNEHKERLRKNLDLVAENQDIGTAIYLTNDKGTPYLLVYDGDFLMYEEGMVSERDCEKTTGRVYDEYLTESIKWDDEADGSDEHESEESEDDMIAEREDELDMAVFDFVSTVIGDNAMAYDANLDAACNDLKEHFLEYMARKHGMEIFRPMKLIDDDGNVWFEDYPYRYLEYDKDTYSYS